MNIKAYYNLTERRSKVESYIEDYDVVIKELRDEAKKLKKGSMERQELMKRANDLKNDSTYRELQIELRTLNYCINTVFYN